MCIPDMLHILGIRYFFLVVFFAFFAGAFFVAMSHHPLPLLISKYVAHKVFDTMYPRSLPVR